MVAQQSLSELSTDQLREMVEALLRTAAAKDEQVTRQSTEIRHKQALIDKLTHENALLKRLKFAAQSERYSAEQRSLLDETLDADLQAVSDEIEQLASAAAAPREKQQPSASRCLPTCRAARFITNPNPPPAAVDAG